MRKFITYTRPIPGCHKSDAPTVVEVEGELVTGLEDVSVMWLPQGEFKFRITAPDFLYEPKEVKQADGSKATVMVPPVYYSHACHWTVYRAHVEAEHMVRQGFEFALRKHGKTYTEEEVAAKIAEITEILL
jgi:hypothetical protein